MKLVKTTASSPEEFCRRMGAELRRFREQAGLSRQQLGERTGIHRNTIERYERGADVPVMTFVRLCVGMGASCGQILENLGVRR